MRTAHDSDEHAINQTMLSAALLAVFGVATITVKRDWRAARAWLISRLRPRP